jgi:hypothetical protein
VINLSTGAAYDPSSPAGFCHQFSIVTFALNPCSVTGANLVLSADFQCANGGSPASCGYINAKTIYRLDILILSYDACPRVVVYGINSAASYLHLNTDVARTTIVASPQQQGTVLYGRCSILPSTGATFQSVTLRSLNAIQQGATGPIDLGNQLTVPQRLQMISQLTQTTPNNGVWDFDLTLDPAFFSITETYYLEAIDLTFANTGTLTKKLLIPMSSARTLRAQARNVVDLVEMSGRGPSNPAAATQAGVLSEKFQMRAAASATATIAAVDTPSSSAPVGVIAAVAAGIGAALIGACIIIVVVVKRRNKRSRATSDAPLVVAALPSSNDLDF